MNSITCEGYPCGNKCIYQAQGKVTTRDTSFFTFERSHV